MPYISHYGSKAQIERYIPQMTAGKCIGAIAMTEPGAEGSVAVWFCYSPCWNDQSGQNAG